MPFKEFRERRLTHTPTGKKIFLPKESLHINPEDELALLGCNLVNSYYAHEAHEEDPDAALKKMLEYIIARQRTYLSEFGDLDSKTLQALAAQKELKGQCMNSMESFKEAVQLFQVSLPSAYCFYLSVSVARFIHPCRPAPAILESHGLAHEEYVCIYWHAQEGCLANGLCHGAE